MKAKSQKGFTLVELVTVITILGILAAVAVPRFVSLQSNARTASLQGALGSVKSAASLVHAGWLANGSSGTTVAVEGASITVNNGYPAATDIATAAQLGANDYTVSASGTTATITINGYTPATAGTCQVTYTEPASAGAAPTYGTSTTGC